MSAAPTRLLIHGASGRMGRALLRLAAEDSRFAVVAAVSGSWKAIACSRSDRARAAIAPASICASRRRPIT